MFRRRAFCGGPEGQSKKNALTAEGCTVIEPSAETGMPVVVDLLRQLFRIGNRSVCERDRMGEMSDAERVGISANVLCKYCEVRLRNELQQRSRMPDTTSKERDPLGITPAEKIRLPVASTRMQFIVKQQLRQS